MANTNAPAETSGTGSGPTTAATSAAEEIEKFKGQFYTLMPRYQRSAATSSGHISQLPNVDSEEDDEENDGDENEGGDTNGSGEEDD